MKPFLLIVSLCFPSAIVLAAGGPGDAAADASDTARVYRMNEVTVTGSRMSTDVRLMPSAVTVITEQAIERSNGTAVSDLLQGAPGIFMKTYGGAGSLQTISARGMGSEYTLILVDGQRYATFQNGLVDLGIFPAADIERIEVARGGYSSLFGADAVGGVVNIITKKPTEGLHADALAGAGSYGFQEYQLSLNGGTDRLSFKGTYRNEHASNAFDCYFHDGPRRVALQRSDADYTMSVADLGLAAKTGETLSHGLSLRSTVAERGVPSALTSASNTGGAARLLDRDHFAQYRAEWKASENGRLLVQSSFHYAEQHYLDLMLVTGGKPDSYDYFNRTLMLTPQYERALGEGSSIVAGAEIVRAWIASSELRNAVRVQSSAFVSSQHRLLFRAALPFELTVFPSVRVDHFSDAATALDPKIGVNLGMQNEDALRLRASLGRNFRMPTFNELYWNPGGNPNLRPERSVSFDAGVLSSLAWLGRLDLEADYFRIDTRDRILWLPVTNQFWSPKNVNRVLSEGVELSARWSMWDDAVAVGYAQTIMRVERKAPAGAPDPLEGKQLPYLPENSGSLDAAFRYSGLTLNIRVAMTGERFITEDNDPRYVLDPFASVDANVGYRLVFARFAAKAKLEALNLFNADYQIIAQQPMPLRALRLSLEVLY